MSRVASLWYSLRIESGATDSRSGAAGEVEEITSTPADWCLVRTLEVVSDQFDVQRDAVDVLALEQVAVEIGEQDALVLDHLTAARAHGDAPPTIWPISTAGSTHLRHALDNLTDALAVHLRIFHTSVRALYSAWTIAINLTQLRIDRLAVLGRHDEAMDAERYAALVGFRMKLVFRATNNFPRL